MARQNVQNDACRMDVVGQSLCTGGFDSLQAIGQDGPEDIDHLAVCAGQAFELFAHAPDRKGQFPFFERSTVA